MNNFVKTQDDYNWDFYPQVHYAQTLDLINNQGLMFQLPENPIVKDGKIDKSYKIHANHRLIYEFVLNNDIKSVFEIGCGYANHLVSLYRLNNNLHLAGCDISDKQIEFAKMRYEEVRNFDIAICDFIEFVPTKKYDFSYSQACLMHLSTPRAKICIEKMCSMSKYVLSCDGGLKLPGFESWLTQFGQVEFLWDFCKEYWTDWYTPAFIIRVGQNDN